MPTPKENIISAVTTYANQTHNETYLGPDDRKAGFSMGVYFEGETILALGRGNANVEFEGAFDGDTVSGIRSLTKEMTAAIVLQWLEEEVQAGTFVGYMTANTLKEALKLPVAHPDLFPEFRALVDENPDTEFDTTITIGQLLSQSSGFQRGFANRTWAALSFKDEESLVRIWLDEGYQEFAPGTKCNYSDLSLWVFGLILREKKGVSWGKLLQDIFDDAGMTRSFSTYGGNWEPAWDKDEYGNSIIVPGPSLYGHVQRNRVSNSATGYMYRDGLFADAYGITDASGNPAGSGYVSAIPANVDVGACIGSVYSTANDMCKWYEYLKGGNVCSVAAYSLMNVTQTGIEDANAGNYYRQPDDPDGINGASYSGGFLNWGYGTTIGSPVYGYPVVADVGGWGGFNAGSMHLVGHDAYVICMTNFPNINPQGGAMHRGAVGAARRMMEELVERMVIQPTVTVDLYSGWYWQPELSGTVDNFAATIDVTIAGSTYSAANNGDGTWTLPVNAVNPLYPGTYDVVVVATDPLGNVGTDATTGEVVVG